MEHIGDFNGDTGHAAAHFKVLLRILHGDHGKTMIELAAELQNTGNVEPDALWLQQLVVGIRVGDHD